MTSRAGSDTRREGNLMATAGRVPGDPDHVLIGVVPNDRDPWPQLSVWIGRDAVTEISLAAAEDLAGVLLHAVKVARGEVAVEVTPSGDLVAR
jgi:hypothetical protein